MVPAPAPATANSITASDAKDAKELEYDDERRDSPSQSWFSLASFASLVVKEH